MVDIHNYKRRHELILKKIAGSSILEENKRISFEFNEYLISEGIGIAKIGRYLQDMIKFAQLLGKPFPDADEKDLRKVVAELNKSDLTENSKKSFKVLIRKLYRFIRNTPVGEPHPPEVKWISLRISNNHRKLPEELLTEKEMKLIVQHSGNTRDRAFLATLAETGARVGEVANMKIRDVAFVEHGARINLSGKTGMRKILVINSSPFLQKWINEHPLNDEPGAHLWYNKRGDTLCYARIASILKKSAKRAGIKKRVYPHLLRHSRATQLASVITEAQMKPYLGWTAGSKMAGVYVHMSGADVDKAILRVNGIEINEKEKKSEMKPKVCARCQRVNPATHRCCENCGLILDEEYAKEVLKKESEREEADEIMNKLMKDEEVLDLLSVKISKLKGSVD